MSVATKNIARTDLVDFFTTVIVRSRHENYGNEGLLTQTFISEMAYDISELNRLALQYE
jgi:hypothetical protein